jgi:hypothetical protein
MAPFSVDDRFVVTGRDAPFLGHTGVVTAIEADSPYPVVGDVEFKDGHGPASYRLSEITPIMGNIPVAEVAEMGT